MAVEEKKVIIEDEFSDENFMVGDESETMYNSDPEVGDAFKVMDPENYQVEDNRNKRLALKSVELAKQNDQLKFQLGNALETIEAKKTGTDISPGVFSNIDIKTGSLGEFTKSIGDSFINVAKAVPDKIDAIFEDPKKRKNMIRGLQIINESSGITSLSQAKSPLGKISSGLLKAEASFTAEDIAKLKAQKKEARRYESIGEKSIYADFEGWKERLRDSKKAFAVADKYNLAKNIALDGKELPTGVLNKTFSSLKSILSEVPGGEAIYNNLVKTFSDEDYIKKHGNKMGLDEQVIFNDLFQAATYAQVVKEVKELYPVSNKDIETLLKAKGDIGSKPEALRRLIAAQMAAREISLGSEQFAYEFFNLEDSRFETKSILASEVMISDKLRKENFVSDETLKTLFGKDATQDNVTNAGYISAYYYQKMKAKELTMEGDPYTIFVTAQQDKEAEIQKIIIENQKKNNKDLLP